MSLLDLFSQRKYRIFLVLLFNLAINAKYCPAQNLNSFRSARTGNFDALNTWQKWNGDEWVAAERLPGREDEIYVEKEDIITLTKDEEIGNVFLFGDTGAGAKLNLNGKSLFVYGSLNAYKGKAPGEPRGSFNSLNWIGNSLNSKIVFKGNSRSIIRRGAWSGNSTNSIFTVEFDPGDGVELIVETPFKAAGFIVKSGVLIQRLNTNNNNCSTFSHTTNNNYGEGSFRIKPGTTFITDCHKDIFFRSESKPLGEVVLEGEMVLLHNQPEMNVIDFQNYGSVTYASEVGTQLLIKNDNQQIIDYHSLGFVGGSSKTIPEAVSLSGNFFFDGIGILNENNTHYHLLGNHNQYIDRKGKPIHSLTVDKADGQVQFNHEVKISETFHQIGGNLDFQGHKLILEKPDYLYLSGSWKNLPSFTWNSLPTDLNEANGIFPFYDREVNGLRSLKLLGSPGPTTSPLYIQNVEIPGVNHNPGFNDYDGTPILHKLNSYYQVLAAPAVMNNLTMKIRADELIVVDPEHLRIVSDTHAAPGDHLQGADRGYYLAKRSLDFNELQSQTFTIGSTGMLSILPLTWLDFQVNYQNGLTRLTWSVTKEFGNEKFIVHRSEGNAFKFEKIGEVDSKGNFEGITEYDFTYQEYALNTPVYFQIEQVDFEGSSTFSEIKMINVREKQASLFEVFPNPHQSGNVNFMVYEVDSRVKVTTLMGLSIYDDRFSAGKVEEVLEKLKPGVYLIEVISRNKRQVSKFIKQ